MKLVNVNGIVLKITPRFEGYEVEEYMGNHSIVGTGETEQDAIDDWADNYEGEL